MVFVVCSLSAQNGFLLKGKVVSGNNSGISFASVVLFSAADSSMQKGAMTTENGEFVFDGLTDGNYYLQVYFVGFERTQIDSVKINGKNKVLKPIVLHRLATQLDEINVVSDKGMYESQAGKMVYNVDGNPNAVGESALELMQNIPSLGTDMDDKVTLRGSKVTVLIDGIESDLSTMLDQIPSDAIESIEVISNPSARYESSTGAGIVNIKLKKTSKVGYNGKFGLGYGTRDKQNLSALLGYNLKKWKFSSSVNYQKSKTEDDQTTERETVTNGVKKYMFQDRNNIRIPATFFIRNSANYYFDDKSFIGFQHVFQDKSQQNLSSYLTDQFDADHLPVSKSSTGSEGKDHNRFNQFSSDFRKIFHGDDNHSLDINLLYSFNTPLNEYDQINQPISLDQGLPVTKFTSDTKDYSNRIRLLKLKADYSQAIFPKWKIETGILASMDLYSQDLDAVRTSFVFSDSTGVFEEASKIVKETSFEYSGYSLSSYGLLSGGFGKYRLSTGLRFEMTVNETKALETIVSEFYKVIPSVHLKQLTSTSYSWELSYTSRILPPNSRQLNPISMSWGEYMKSSGNPNLKPEVFSQAEFSNLWTGKNSNYNLTFFVKNQSDIIGKWYYVEQDEEGKEVTFSTFENLGSVFSSGIDAGAMFAVKDLVFRPAFSAFYNQINGDKFGPKLDRDQISVSAKLNSSYKITKDLVLQVSGRYNSPVISEDGKRFSYYTFDAGLRTNLFKRKVSVILKGVDVFDTMEYDKIVNQRINYTSWSHVDPHNFQIYLELAYKFNSLIKKKA